MVNESSPEPFPAWTRSPEDVVAHHGSSVNEGLSLEAVESQRQRYGFNELKKPDPQSMWALILEQFDDTLVKILLLAAGVSFVLAFFEGDGEEGIRAFIEPAVIILILILNAAVGVWQESNAENALEALKEMSAETARVWRDGQLFSELPARELVPGDIIELHAGDRVPADCRLVRLKTAVLRVEQAALTGESLAVSKTPAATSPLECELQSKEGMIFAGTGIASGSAMAVVNSIGMGTEIGKIQEQIQAAEHADNDTPLKRKLDEFGETLAKAILWVCVLVWLINVHHFVGFRERFPSSGLPDPRTISFSPYKATFYFKVAVALAVAAIPEGLPAVITTCLALGTRKMAKRNAIVRRLPSVETLGCTTVICSDKTGTLTTNQMSAVSLVAFGGELTKLREYEVTGTTFDPKDGGVVGLHQGGKGGKGSELDQALLSVARVCALCNEAQVSLKGGVYHAVGQPTEAALLVLAEKLGTGEGAAVGAVGSSDSCLEACAYYTAHYKTISTLEFDRNRKSMSVLCAPTPAHQGQNGLSLNTQGPSTRRQTAARQERAGNVLLVKGAAECVLDRCTKAMLSDGTIVPLDAGARAKLAEAVATRAGHALRLLAFAVKPASDLPPELASYDGTDDGGSGHRMLATPELYESIESGLTFVGLAGLRDPPRPEVPAAIAACHAAGIRVLVITGDNKLTAEAVCRDIGIFHQTSAKDFDAIKGRSFTGSEFTALPEAERRRILSLPGGLCFSRAEPRHKQDIVRLLKDMGHVTAMTGDGVNDAPALKLADIGVAMGIAGTEVAKQASDMVLADDNFATVVAAVEEGRAIYDNMKAFIRYMISSNIGEVASIFLSAALGLPEGLIPVQLLWVNLVTDGPPATALGFNKADPDIMSKKPRRADDHFITPWILFRWLVVGAYVGFATVGVFASWYTSSSFLGLVDLSADGHTPVSLTQLRHWESCRSSHLFDGFKASPYTTAAGETVAFTDPCDYFTVGKIKASTLSLSVLVAIEMFNAANALSEDNSLLSVPLWTNPWLLVAMCLSFGLHFVVMYVPFLADVFSIVPLSFNEWLLVVAYALPVVFIDEVLKFVGRNFVNRPKSSSISMLTMDGKKKNL